VTDDGGEGTLTGVTADSVHLSRIADGYLAVDGDWTITDASTPAAALVDHDRSALVGADLWEVFPAAAGTRFQREYESVLSTGEPTSFRTRYDPLGAWFEVDAHPDGDGIAIYFRDVTDDVLRDRLFRRLETATGRLQATETVDETWAATVDIVETVLELPLVSCRRRIDDRLVPVAASEAAEEFDFDPVAPGDPLWDVYETGEQTVIDPADPYEGVANVVLYPLSEHGLLGVADFETETYPEYLVEAGATLSEHLATALDRAAREETLRERERSLERYETIVQAAADAIYWLDDEGRFQRVNEQLLALTGQDRETLVGAHASLVFPESDVATCEARIREVVRGERSPPVTESVTAVAADGTRRHCEVSIAPLFVEDDLDGTVGVLRDRTDLKRREQRLVVMDRVLRHNLRNKMNLVLGELDELSAGEHTAVIRSAATDLLSLSDDARRFGDVIDPEGETSVTLDLAEIVERVVGDFRRGHPEATLRRETVPDATVSANPAVEMAVAELVENALTHAGDAPTVAVSVRRDGEWVVLEVVDDGPGIDQTELEALETGTERPLTHASGLGLWLVSWTVESSGGTVAFDTNGGTCIRLRLPAASRE
jgi:PAS domain S-box-containing protein